MSQSPIFADVAPTDPAFVVLTFLESAGKRSDAEFYLKLFREVPKASFAILVIEAPVIRYTLPSIADQLRFLRGLGLFAPVVLGIFDPARAERGSSRLAQRCEDLGPVIHQAREPNLARLLKTALENEQLPIVSLAGLRDGTEAERFDWLGELAEDLGSRKIVLVRRRGGLGPRSRAPLVLGPGHVLQTRDAGISVVNLTTDFEPLRDSGLLEPPEDLALLTNLRSVLLRRGNQASAVVTSPFNILRELFTEKGAGTFVKRGTTIRRHESYEAVDVQKLHALFDSSFRKKLLPSFFERTPLCLYLEESYRGAAVLEPSIIAPFLSKFAVDRVAQGEGVGRDLWQAMVRHHPALFWRVRAENPIAGWYTSLCDGMMRAGPWIVYWRGVDAAQISSIIDEATRRPPDFSG